jgi:hypothetical protein
LWTLQTSRPESDLEKSFNKESEKNEVREESLFSQTSTSESEEPPPSNLTMKERLLKLQQKREMIKVTKLPYFMNASNFESNKSADR